jgi:hypothetical protein
MASIPVKQTSHASPGLAEVLVICDRRVTAIAPPVSGEIQSLGGMRRFAHHICRI